MGSSLGLAMANIIMMGLENRITKPLMKHGTTKFYCRHVDDTLFVVKPQDVSRIHICSMVLIKNLKFT